MPPKPSRRIALIGLGGTALVLLGLAGMYHHFSALIDKRLSDDSLTDSVSLYAAPRLIAPGDAITAEQLVSELMNAGYSPEGSSVGRFRRTGDAVDIEPGEQSYFSPEPGRMEFRDGRVLRISNTKTGAETQQYGLEPQLLTNRAAGQAERRKLVRFDQIPEVLRQAVLAAEDKHFFHHPGLDPLRAVKSLYVNLRSGRKEQGGSTLTMQLARSLWLDGRKNWSRKAREVAITLVLEQKLSKEEIFTHYVNQVYFGQHQTMAVRGFAEAARVYLGADLNSLAPASAALLAGLVQRPVYLNPHRHPERAIARRNLVLGLMRDNGFLTAAACEQARAKPLPQGSASHPGDAAPYFLALAEQELQAMQTGPVSRVYTTLDASLQRAAEEAVRAGMAEVDKAVGTSAAPAQVALIALDPHTGEVRALVGGRSYASSQLNRATAVRQPGSVFKPLVYAAALAEGPWTPDSMLADVPATFQFEGQTYSPSNHGGHYFGEVTMRTALARSLNIPAIQVARQVSYRKVAAYAYEAGLNRRIQPTPAIALGAYEVTPLEMAAAYTVFANGGLYTPPTFLSKARLRDGRTMEAARVPARRVLSRAVAFQMQDMLAEVVRSGTAASVRARGMKLDAAGKTGTSRDGWFVGFTGDLLCAVWVGYDDNRELGLEGSRSALPVWTEFMRRATEVTGYRRPLDRTVPADVVPISIDPDTGLLAGASCPSSRTVYVSADSRPRGRCQHERDEEFNTETLAMPIAMR